MAKRRKCAWSRKMHQPRWVYYKTLCHRKARREVRRQLGFDPFDEKIDLKAPYDAYEDWWGWD